MEEFRGPAIPIEKFDAQKLGACDVVVLILGHTYGSCPQAGTKSYTELEYEAALETSKPIFVFLALEDPLPYDPAEAEAQQARQRAFRERAAAGCICNTFRSAEELATGIVQAIYNFQRSLIRSAELSSFLPLPPRPNFVHPCPLAKNFSGRRKEQKRLTQWLVDGPNVLSIAAIGGIGKSSLTWFWAVNEVQRLSKIEGVLWWSFYAPQASFASFAREAFRYASNGQPPPVSTYDQVQGLQRMLVNKRFLLVLDGFERELHAYARLNAVYQGDHGPEDSNARSCVDPNAARFLPWVASAPMRSRILVTTRLHPTELDDLEGCEQWDLDAFSPEDAVEFFNKQEIKATRAEIQDACAPYAYHPLALRLLTGLIVRDHQLPRQIQAARYSITAELKGKEKHHILEVAYDAMDELRRHLLSQLSAFRSSMPYEAIAELNPFRSKQEFLQVLNELIDRGLLLFDTTLGRYDLHPIVREYAYERLTDKAGEHARLRDYFAKFPPAEAGMIDSLDALAPATELFYHYIGAGQYDEAGELFEERLGDALNYRFGAHLRRIELLRQLFPDGEDWLPRLSKQSNQARILNALANS